MGPKDLAKGQVALAKRVRAADAHPEGVSSPEGQALSEMAGRLESFQDELLAAALARREANSHRGVSSFDEAVEILETQGGFVYTGWSGDPKVEERMKEAAKATIRVIPDNEFRIGDPAGAGVSGARDRPPWRWCGPGRTDVLPVRGSGPTPTVTNVHEHDRILILDFGVPVHTAHRPADPGGAGLLRDPILPPAPL